MHLRLAFAGAALCAGAWAQSTVERVLPFRYSDSPQAWQEAFNAIRSVADIQRGSIDRAARTLTLTGDPDRMAAAEWVFSQLDRPQQPVPPTSAANEFRPAGMGDTVLYAYSLSYIDTPRSLQEIVNAVRSVSDMQRVFPISGIRAVVMRGTEAQVAMAKWVLQQLDAPSPANGQTPVVREFHGPDAGDVVAGIFFLAHVHSPEALQELVNATRSVADVQRLFPFNQSYAMVMRGTKAQAELTRWLVERLDTPGVPQAGEYLLPGAGESVVRLFVPGGAPSAEALQQTVNQIRAESQAQRVYPVTSRSAIAFQGTAAQAAVAEAVVRAR